jgi:threonine synthase
VRAASGYLLDPHTACGYVALERCRKQSATPAVILATAHPAKFPDAMEEITGEHPPLPPSFASLLTDEERFRVLPNDLAAVEAHVESVARAVGAGAT